MKRLLSLIITLLLCVSACFGLTACNPDNNGGDTDNQQPVGKVCLNDFETYKPDFQVIRSVK